MTIRTEVDDDHIILSCSQQLYFCGSSTILYADAEDDDGYDGDGDVDDSYSDGDDCFDPLHTCWLFYADEAALQLVNCLLMIMMMILMMIVLMAITVLMAHPLYTSWLAHLAHLSEESYDCCCMTSVDNNGQQWTTTLHHIDQ